MIGEIDPAKLAAGTSMTAEEALHFGLIPRMHRGIFAMNEIPELDELVQVGLFNILEERDVQIRGYPVQFDLDVLILFSANPATYNRSGKVIPQLKDRIGSLIQTHYPLDRSVGIEIMEQEAGIDLGGDYPVLVPLFMKEIIEQISVCARKSKYVDHQSGVSARFSIANYRTMVASARHRGVRLGEKPAVPRISDLGHLYSSSLGKLELDMMGSQQMSERQVIEAIHGGGHPQGVRGVRGEERPGRDRAGVRQGREDRGGRPAAVVAVRGAAEARAEGVGEGVRGEPRRRARRCGRRASSSCWRGCTPATASRGRRSTEESCTRSSKEGSHAKTQRREGFDMPRTTTKPPKKVTASANTANAAPPVGDVMTLAEAAAYLRLPESEVARLVHEAGLPGRTVGEEWRFLKTALQDWLRAAPPTKPSKEALLSRAGSWKDDPDLDEMLKEIYKRRGRPMTEGGE